MMFLLIIIKLITGLSVLNDTDLWNSELYQRDIDLLKLNNLLFVCLALSEFLTNFISEDLCSGIFMLKPLSCQKNLGINIEIILIHNLNVTF